jgi:hypothetical protein
MLAANPARQIAWCYAVALAFAAFLLPITQVLQAVQWLREEKKNEERKV